MSEFTSQSLRNLFRPHIANLVPYSSARDENNALKKINMDANENPFGTYNRYPDPQQRALKERWGKLQKYPTQNLFVGNGSDEVIDLLFRVFCEPGIDRCLAFGPTYGMYKVSADINGVDILEQPLLPSFDWDIEGAIDTLKDSKIKMVFICSPNNPTGQSMPRESVERILEAFEGIVILDEAYIDFSPLPSATEWEEQNPRLVVVKTLSKAWGLASLRIGFAMADKQIIEALNKIKPPYNVSSANQELALEALGNTEYFQQCVQTLILERDKMLIALTELEEVQKVHPSDGNFLLVQFKNPKYTLRALAQRGIILRDRSKQVGNCLRISIGTPRENNILLNNLKELENEKSPVYR
jgi:histidinol-phosphate aminotransferase